MLTEAYVNSKLPQLRHNITPRWQISPQPLRQGCADLTGFALGFRCRTSWCHGDEQATKTGRAIIVNYAKEYGSKLMRAAKIKHFGDFLAFFAQPTLVELHTSCHEHSDAVPIEV